MNFSPQQAVRSAVLHGLRADWGQVGPASLIGRSARRLAALRLGEELRQLLHLPIYQSHLESVGQSDALFFLSHRHYLARNLTLAERASAAAGHYLAEAQAIIPEALAAVYQGPGLVLWSSPQDQRYEIRLTGGQDVAHEGAASLTLTADGTKVCVMSFSIVPRSLVEDAATAGRAVLITRKQLTRDRGYQKPFFAAFDRSAPAHLVLAALEGLVQARGGDQLFGLRAPAHPIYSAALAPHLGAAYCEFWQSLDGRIASDRAYALGIPMRLRPVEDMQADRRERALARRSHAEDIRAAARAVMTGSLLADAEGL